MTKKLKVCIIGAENWSSAIATAVGANVIKNERFDERVHQYVYDELVSDSTLSEVINDTHENIKYLPGIHMPANLIAVNDLIDAAQNADILIFATPQHFIKSYCNILTGRIKPDAIAVSLIKGIQNLGDGKIELYSQSISRNLSIPCYSMVCANCAMEMAQGKLCEITIGCNNEEHANLLQEIFQTDNCKVVLINDVDGVELFGSLKDIIALGAGLIDGLRLGENTRVAVLHLGIKEMMRFVKDFYPSSKLATFFESCGVADLVTSCHGDKHVNFAKTFVTTGKTIQELESNLMNGRKLLGPQVAEEVYSFLKKELKENQYPLFTSIHKICRNEQPPETIIDSLRNHPDLHKNTISELLDKEHAAMMQKQKPTVFEQMSESLYVENQPAFGLHMSSSENQYDNKQDQIVSQLDKNDDNLPFMQPEPYQRSFGEHINVTTSSAEHNFPESFEPTKVTIWLKGAPDFNETIIEVKNNSDELISEMPMTMTTPMNDSEQRTVTVELIEPVDFVEEEGISVGDELEKKNNINLISAHYNSDDNNMQEQIDSIIVAKDKELLTDDDKIRRAAQTAKQQVGFKSKRFNELEDSKEKLKEDDWFVDNDWRPEYKITKKEPNEMENTKITDKEDWLGDNEWREEYEIIRKEPNEEKVNKPKDSNVTDENTAKISTTPNTMATANMQKDDELSAAKILDLSEFSGKEFLVDLKYNEHNEPLFDQERRNFSQEGAFNELETTELKDMDSMVEYKQRVHASIAQGSGSDNADEIMLYSDDDTQSLLQANESASGKLMNQNSTTTTNTSMKSTTGVAQFSSSSYKDPHLPDKSKTVTPDENNKNNEAATENEKLIDYFSNESKMASDQFATLKGFDDFEKNWLNYKEHNRNKKLKSILNNSQYSEEDLINIFKLIRDSKDGLESSNYADSEWDWLRVSSTNEQLDSDMQNEITNELYQDDTNFLENSEQGTLSQEQDIPNKLHLEKQDLTTNEFQGDTHTQPLAEHEPYNQFRKGDQHDFHDELDDNRLPSLLRSDIKNDMSIDDYIRQAEYEPPKLAASSATIHGQHGNQDDIHDVRFKIDSDSKTNDHMVNAEYEEYKQADSYTSQQEQNAIRDALPPGDNKSGSLFSEYTTKSDENISDKQDAGQQVTFDLKDSTTDFLMTPPNDEQHKFVIESIEIEKEEPLPFESEPRSSFEQTELMPEEVNKLMYETQDKVLELEAHGDIEGMQIESPDNYSYEYVDHQIKTDLTPVATERVSSDELTNLYDENQSMYIQDSPLDSKQSMHEFAEPSLSLEQHNAAEEDIHELTLEEHLSMIKDSLTLEERLHNVEILTSSLVADKQSQLAEDSSLNLMELSNFEEDNITFEEMDRESRLNLEKRFSNENEQIETFDKQSLFLPEEAYYPAMENIPTSMQYLEAEQPEHKAELAEHETTELAEHETELAEHETELAEHETELAEHEIEQAAYRPEEADYETEHAAAYGIDPADYETEHAAAYGIDQADFETEHAAYEIEQSEYEIDQADLETEHAAAYEIEQSEYEIDQAEFEAEQRATTDEIEQEARDETDELEERMSLDEIRHERGETLDENEQAALEEAELSIPPQKETKNIKEHDAEIAEKVKTLWRDMPQNQNIEYQQSDSPYHGETKRTKLEAYQDQDIIVVKVPPKKPNMSGGLQKKGALQQPYHPPINPRVRIPQPPFDGREHEYHTLAYNAPQPFLTERSSAMLCKKSLRNVSVAHLKRPFTPVYYTKPLLSFLRISRATRILCALQVGMFAAMLSKYKMQ